MAVTRGKSPVTMTAAADVLTPAGESFIWHVISIVVADVSGSGGAFSLLDVVSGRPIYQGTVPDGGQAQLTLACPMPVDDIYVETLPAGSKVFVYVQ